MVGSVEIVFDRPIDGFTGNIFGGGSILLHLFRFFGNGCVAHQLQPSLRNQSQTYCIH